VSASLATVAGAWLIPTFQRLFCRAVLDFQAHRSIPKLVNGGATIMMAVFIDPHMSGMTDDVVEAKVTETQFRKAIVWLVGSRLAGTVTAQALLVPAAVLTASVARVI
jgi:hypothetical protein